jgi:hypothetical protein
MRNYRNLFDDSPIVEFIYCSYISAICDALPSDTYKSKDETTLRIYVRRLGACAQFTQN